MASPLLSRLYVQQVEINKLKQRYEWDFRTKNQLGLDLLRQGFGTTRAFGSKSGFVVVFDGTYAARELVHPLIAEGATVVTRLRRDSKLFDVLVNKPGLRGRPHR